jgi:HEAT repeat protein
MLRVTKWVWVVALISIVVAANAIVAAPTGYERTIEALGHSDSAARLNAIEELAQGGRSTLGTLLAELDADHAPLVKSGLAEAIRRIGVGRNEESTLTALLASSSPVTRHATVTILRRYPRLAQPTLLKMAESKRELPSIRAAAVLALSESPDLRPPIKALAHDLSVSRTVRDAATTALATAGLDGASDVKQIAEDASRPREERMVAIRSLARPGSQGVSALKDLANSTTPWVRAEAIGALLRRSATSELSLMATAATRDADAYVRATALESLIALGGGPTYREGIIGLLGDADVRVQALAINYLGRSGGDIAARLQAALRGLLASGNFNVRHEAALALFAHGDSFGAATMLADSAALNISQARKARQAYDLITGVKK